MSEANSDPDPYAELDYRSDASELSEELRRPVRVRRDRRAGSAFPTHRRTVTRWGL